MSNTMSFPRLRILEGARRGRVRLRAAMSAAVAAGLAIGFLTGCEDPDSSSEAKPAVRVEESAAEFTMPDVVGMVLQDAQDLIQGLGSYLMDQQDASGAGRMQINDSNWTVCSQDPAAGESVPVSTRVVLASVKLDEHCPGASSEGADFDESDQSEEPEPQAPEPAPESPEPEHQDPEPDPMPEMTVAQEQAVRKARSYLDFSGFSKKGLIDQLEFEGFSPEDASFAVENITVNWKHQAVRKAEDYLAFSAFSKSGLMDQLEFEGFTSKQAKHAVDAIEVDWNEQAALKAQNYLDFQAFSRSGLIDQLVFEGFTRDQAEYGADSVGL